MKLKKYRKKENQIVIGVQLNLETDGFLYVKWGGKQRCKSGDWLVNNDDDYYTINDEVFSKTYREIGPGQYVKFTAVWAAEAKLDGKVKTNEGYTSYRTGDYLVSNNPDGSDSYAVSKSKFEKMYQETD